MRNILTFIFILLFSNVNAQTNEQIIAKYENGIRGKGYNGAGFFLKVKDDNIVLTLSMDRSKKATMVMPLKDRQYHIKMLRKTLKQLEKGEKEHLNSNKIIGNYSLGKLRMELEFEGRGKGRRYKGLVFINVYKKDKKLVYLAMSKFHAKNFLNFISDENFNKYLKAKKKI